MTPRQHQKRLIRIIKTWRQRLLMEHIEIEVEWSEQPEDPDAMASVHTSDLYDYAIVRFANEWHEQTLEQLNRIVVHELLHVMFRDFGEAIRSIDVVGSLSTDVRLLWHARCNSAEEALIDRLANRLIENAGIVE